MFSRLMLVTQFESMQPSFEEALEEALGGGAKLVQLRERNSSRVLECAGVAARLCEKYGAQLQLNCGDDSLKLAQQFSKGVHLPERESIKAARHILGPNTYIGQSVHSVEVAQRAKNDGANYLVFGSVFSTNSHPGEAPAGLEELRKVCQAVSIPVIAIGGIDAQNAQQCLRHGAHGVAVVSAVWRAQSVRRAVEDLNQSLKAHNASTRTGEN